MPVYATPAELAAWTGTEAPEDAERLLRQASRLVRLATVTAVYPVNRATSLPTETEHLAAFRDATCAQVETWLALGVDPTAGPASSGAGKVAASGIGGANVQYATSVTADQALAAATVALGTEAADILAEAGLMHGYVTGL